MEKIIKGTFISILLLIVFLLFFTINIGAVVPRQEANLVVFGDNIVTENKPFIQNTGIYLSKDIVERFLDEYIYYDEIATKVIITTQNGVYKLKVDENKMTKNFEEISIDNPVKIVNGQPFVDINLFKEIYGIIVEYNDKTSTISIDKKFSTGYSIKYNSVNVYEDISTKSKIVDTLEKNNTVIVYSDSLNHNRWYKVKTNNGIVGYISKNNIDFVKEETSVDEQKEEVKNNEKITMFWQYGSNLKTLGNKIDGVDVVSPTWYELENTKGDISSKFSQDYYNKAKENGYKIWPIITNGFDSSNYAPADTSAMLNSEQSRENFIKNLLKIVRDNKLDGINIDFESMKEEDRLKYTQLIRELAPILRNEGVKVSVDMYFVSYIDRKGIGAASDYVMLMGYDQRGNWSSEAGSIAEISWVEKNIDALINSSNIPSEKIILGIPFYSRLWTQKSGDSKLTTKVYSMQDCQDFLKDNKLTVSLDEKSGQNYAEYTKGITTYKLWLEDIESVKRRIELVNKYSLAGISGWQKGLETNDVWNTIKENMK